MPNRWPIASGNWSNPAIWSGSLIPTASDDVFANAFTINVDTNFQVLSLRNTSGTGITVGGSFNFNTPNISGSCTNTTANTAIVPGGNNLIQVTANTGSITLNVSSSVSGFTTFSSNVILYTGFCDFNLNGISFTGGSTNTNNVYINKTSPGTLTVVGNINGGSQNSAHCIISTRGNTVIIGNVIGGTNGSAQGINQTNGELTILGNVDGGTTGNASAVGVSFIDGNKITIVGNVTGGGLAAGVTTTTLCEINITGNTTASANANAVSSTNASGVVILNGNMFNSGSRQAIYCQNLFLSDTGTTQARFFTSGSLQDRTLYSPNTFPDLPSGSNVRSTTSYGPGNELLGSLIMPDPKNVRYGIITDNTTGSALLSAQNLFDEIATNQHAVPTRLRKISTIDTVGTLLTSFNNGGN